jgi:hypothetical protein
MPEVNEFVVVKTGDLWTAMTDSVLLGREHDSDAAAKAAIGILGGEWEHVQGIGRMKVYERKRQQIDAERVAREIYWRQRFERLRDAVTEPPISHTIPLLEWFRDFGEKVNWEWKFTIISRLEAALAEPTKDPE